MSSFRFKGQRIAYTEYGGGPGRSQPAVAPAGARARSAPAARGR